MERAIRLSPRDPSIDIWYMQIGAVLLVQSRTDEAILWLEKARGTNPAAPLTHGYLTSAYALKGEMERAASALAEARRLSGDGTYFNIARLNAVRYFGVPKVHVLYEATYFAGLRKAGMRRSEHPEIAASGSDQPCDRVNSLVAHTAQKVRFWPRDWRRSGENRFRHVNQLAPVDRRPAARTRESINGSSRIRNGTAARRL